jgi:hypothetical protein
MYFLGEWQNAWVPSASTGQALRCAEDDNHYGDGNDYESSAYAVSARVLKISASASIAASTSASVL